MAAPSFDYAKASTAIAECYVLGPRATTEKLQISERSLQRWRARLAKGDAKLAALVADKIRAVEADWAEALPGAICACIAFLHRAAKDADPTDPVAVHAIAGAMKLLAEVTISRRVIDEKLARGQAALEEARARISRSHGSPPAPPGAPLAGSSGASTNGGSPSGPAPTH